MSFSLDGLGKQYDTDIVTLKITTLSNLDKSKIWIPEPLYVEADEELEILHGLHQRVHLIGQPEVGEAHVEARRKEYPH